MSKKIENLAKLIGKCDNKELDDVVAIVKNHRKKLAHATKLSLRVGLEVWFAGKNGMVEKVNHVNAICRDINTNKRWTVPITMIEVA